MPGIKFIPHKYQQYCIDRIIDEYRLGVFLDMGLGKTVIVLTAVDYLFTLGMVDKVLIVAPKEVAKNTWSREKWKWEHTQALNMGICLGSAPKRMEVADAMYDITVINRENVPWLEEYWGDHWPYDMVVIDEFTSFKNRDSKRFKALKKVLPKIKRLVGLTGTPAPKGLEDLWAQVYLLDEGERLGKFITHYRANYFTQDAWNTFVYKPKPGAKEQIMEKISDICISMKAEDYIDMPETIYNTIPVSLNARERKLYRELEKDYITNVNLEEITVAGAAALSNKLLQLCNGAVYNDEGEAIEVHKAKIEALKNLIDSANGQSILVFVSFVSDYDRIRNELPKSLVVKTVKDEGFLDDWNAGRVDIALAHPASTAYGLNMQEGGHITVWFGMQWSLELYTQANARLRRQGQTETVIINHLVVEDSIDEKVMQALESKNITQESIIAAIKARIGENI